MSLRAGRDEQEIAVTDMNSDVRELSVAELTLDELEIAAGGTWRTEKIHIDYHRMDNFNDPTAARYA
jgi:hypothetical protein